jgi:predicted ATPase
MLKKISIDNFKSFINFTFEPKPLNLLIGPNNAGKTNLCQAMRFISLTSMFPVSDAAIYSSNSLKLSNSYFDKPTVDIKIACDLPYKNKLYSFEYFLSINKEPKPVAETGLKYEIASEILKVTGGHFNSVVLLENKYGASKILNEKAYKTNRTIDEQYVPTHISPDNTLLNKLFEFETSSLANHFKKYLGSWTYYDIETSSLRKSEQQPYQFWLNPDGSNLASVLHNLKTTDEATYRKLLDMVQIIDPKLYVINFFIPPGSERIYMSFTGKDGIAFDVTSVSNGTLRYLSLCYVVLSNAIFSTKMPSPLILFEEPENGVYVGYYKELFTKFDPDGKSGQYIFTTHSPYFIDLFDKYLEGVFNMSNEDGRHSEIKSLDTQKIEKLLSEPDFPLGELHFRGMLR